MPNIIKPKRSTVAAKVPTTAQMSAGEIAINSTDQKIYTYDGTNILQIGAGKLSALGDVVLTSLTTNQILQWNGTNFVNATLSAGSGTVTSVALSLPSIFTVSGSPVTTTGTLTATLASQTANTVFAAPNGASGSPTFRALVAADIPALTLENLPDAWTKRSVKVATTASITLSGTQTIDGVAVVAGDRVLVKDQSPNTANGIYVVAAGAWARSADSDTATEIAGSMVNVDQGTANGGLIFDNDFKSTDTLGSAAMVWNRVVDTGLASVTTPSVDGTATVGTSLSYARADHIHPTDTSRAPLASPSFTGTPLAPTAAVDTNTTQLATTAYVVGQGYLKSATATSTYAPLASPSLTGTPLAPTPATTDSSTKIATTAYVKAQVAAGGAIYENSNTISASYTITSGKNGISAGPITIGSGVVVTIPSGSKWAVI